MPLSRKQRALGKRVDAACSVFASHAHMAPSGNGLASRVFTVAQLGTSLALLWPLLAEEVRLLDEGANDGVVEPRLRAASQGRHQSPRRAPQPKQRSHDY